MSVLHACFAYTLYAIQDTYKIQRATDSLELELKAVVSYYVGAGKQSQPPNVL